MLNEAGVDVMLSGHHHKHINVKPGDCGKRFPILLISPSVEDSRRLTPRAARSLLLTISTKNAEFTA